MPVPIVGGGGGDDLGGGGVCGVAIEQIYIITRKNHPLNLG